MGDEGRKRLHPRRVEKTEDQRVSGAVCAGADAQSWLRSGLDAMPEKCI